MKCIFCEMVNNNIKCHKIWEDDKHMAFLSIYPNTRGVTVVIPKKHYSSYIFRLDDDVITDLIMAAKHVAGILDKKFTDSDRTGLIFEGYGINHIHAKLFPMHGTKNEKWEPIKSDIDKYFDSYEGYLSSHDAKLANEEELIALAKYLRE